MGVQLRKKIKPKWVTRLIVFLVASFVAGAGTVHGGIEPGQLQLQEDHIGDESLWYRLKEVLTQKKDLGEDRILSPILFPFVTPEAGLGLAAGGLLSFKTDRENESQPRSDLRINLLGSTGGNVGFASRLNSFWGDDFFRFNFFFGGKRSNLNYYGVGYDAGFDTPQGELTTEYESKVLAFKPILLWRVAGDFFAGINGDLNRLDADDIAPGMAEDPVFQEFGDSYLSSGLGLSLSYDSRDVTVNAWSGRLLEFHTTHYLEELGSDNRFDLYSLDYREYIQISRPGRTIALRAYGQFGDGEIPWSMLPSVGGSRSLRGYEKGRFRDRTVVMGIAEYRHQFSRGNKELSPHGLVFWVGYGLLGEDINDLSGNGLPNVGVGYRFELQERMNARIDFGVGDDDKGIYLSIHEAF